MRNATSPRWIYVMLIVMGLGFMAGSFAFYRFVPFPAGLSVAIIWLIMGAGMAFFALLALRGRGEDNRVRREGLKATATLLSASMSGVVINGVPRWVLKLRIEGLGAPYETTFKLQTFSPPATGARFPVRVDPSRRDHIVLADDDAAAVTSSETGPATLDLRSAPPQVRDALRTALEQAGLVAGEVVNADGSRTIATTSLNVDGAEPGTADVVRSLAELDRMRSNGSLDQAEFDVIKRKLLGEIE